MSDEEEDIEEEEDGEEEGESGGSKRKLFLIIGAVAVLLLVGGGVGAYFMFAGGEEEEVVKENPPGPPVYHEFPQVVVDLKKKGKRTNYIKVKVVVEIVTRDLPLLQAQELKILDKIQSYLRSQTRADVAEGTGTERMRTGITQIISEVMGEVKIEGVLFREILLQ